MSEGRDIEPVQPGEGAAEAVGERRVVTVSPDQVWQAEPPGEEPIATAPEHSFYRPVLTVIAVSWALMGVAVVAVVLIWWLRR